MHPKNIHNTPYNFSKLVQAHEGLKPWVFTNAYEKLTIDFSNPKAVLALNKAILKMQYGLLDWNIPDGYLCPPIPGRVDYIHHIADLLKEKGLLQYVKGLDVGVGANCIYPILGAQAYNWDMVGTDIDKNAVLAAKKNIALNPQLSKKIEIRHQENSAGIFDGMIRGDEYLTFTMCNPPFHTSKEAAAKASLRKLSNLGVSTDLKLNFGGQANELWCNGGEALFIKRMIKQSIAYSKQVGIFTSLVSKKEHIPKLKKQLSKLNADYGTIEMEQGHKKSRILFWTFTR